jgi:RimJ/RimL family protein N-acetyltransferase
MSPAELESERLCLQPWDEAHASLLVELSSDPRVVRWIGLGTPWDAKLAREVSDRQRRHWLEHGFGWRALVDKETNERIGFTALNFLGDAAPALDPEEFEIGWWLKPSVWGRGFATEGARAMLTEAFGRVAAPSVIARIQPANDASARVARALGLELEGSTAGRYDEPVEIFRLTADAFRSL